MRQRDRHVVRCCGIDAVEESVERRHRAQDRRETAGDDRRAPSDVSPSATHVELGEQARKQNIAGRELGRQRGGDHMLRDERAVNARVVDAADGAGARPAQEGRRGDTRARAVRDARVSEQARPERAHEISSSAHSPRRVEKLGEGGASVPILVDDAAGGDSAGGGSRRRAAPAPAARGRGDGDVRLKRHKIVVTQTERGIDRRRQALGEKLEALHEAVRRRRRERRRRRREKEALGARERGRADAPPEVAHPSRRGRKHEPAVELLDDVQRQVRRVAVRDVRQRRHCRVEAGALHVHQDVARPRGVQRRSIGRCRGQPLRRCGRRSNAVRGGREVHAES